MADSFLDFVKTLPEQGKRSHRHSEEELDQETFKYGRTHQYRGTQLLLQHPQPQRRGCRGFRQ